MIYVLDTNAWSDFIRNRGRIARKLAVTPITRVMLAAPVLYELRRGSSETATASRTRALIDEIAKTYDVLPLSADAAEAAASIAQKLKRKGQMLHHLDALVAGVCASHDATLVTRDRVFAAVAELRCEDWTAG